MNFNQGVTYPTLEAAARAYGAAHGVAGRPGGHLYQDGKHVGGHGWGDYGRRLVDKGVIDPQDASGQSVCRIPERRGIRVRPYAAWRFDARQFVLTGKEITR